jgi:hypothetical protein
VKEVGWLAVTREIQVPLLAVLLIGGGLTKARQALRARHGPGPTAMFAPWLRRPAAVTLCTTELILGAALLLTAGRAGPGAPALAVRAITALLFGTAAAALHELRARRPGAGCGCFGELSRTPVNLRVIARATLLCVAALCSIGAPPLRMPDSAGQAGTTLAAAAIELAALAALSPEISQALTRLSHADPCELREVPVWRTLSTLRASTPWRNYQRFLSAPAPVDIWREGCWRFLVFPAVLASRHVDIVFAVHLAGRGAPIRVGLLDSGPTFAAAPDAPVRDPLQISNPV